MAVRRMPTESDEVRVRFLFLDVCGDFDPFAHISSSPMPDAGPSRHWLGPAQWLL